MIAKVYSAIPSGFSGALVEVEGDKNHGLPAFNIVGMANKTISEARDRVRSALVNSDFSFPDRKVTINLAPAELQKDGSHLDLPIALCVLALSNQLRQDDLKDRLFVGELSLEGSLRPVRGIINIVEAAKKHGLKEVFLPLENLASASLIEGIRVIGVQDLKELFLYLKHQIDLPDSAFHAQIVRKTKPEKNPHLLDHIKGQDLAKRALSIAIAGHHNILISGPPGAGKTMLAKTALSLLPPLSKTEQIALTKLYSLTSSTSDVIASRPFRTPHHTASVASVIGGGTDILPGEISLAHLGVLFLDELPEYPRSVLESLRQPLEDNEITISRAKQKVTFPAGFMLIATMNPCPCGFYGDKTHACTCSANEIKLYQKKLSGPLLDRIDLRLVVQKVPTSSLIVSEPKAALDGPRTRNRPKNPAGNTPQNAPSPALKSAPEHDAMKARIAAALSRQRDRYRNDYTFNSSLSSHQVSTLLNLSKPAEDLLKSASDRLNLSARSFYKTVKVAQTIADLDACPEILPEHVSEALSYRLDRPSGSLIIQAKPSLRPRKIPEIRRKSP